jgi:hypothetical protein
VALLLFPACADVNGGNEEQRRASEILFGFLTGTDIGEVGEKEVESETTDQFG